MRSTVRLGIRDLWRAVLGIAAVLIGSIASANSRNALEGTWQLSQPQTLLVPSDGGAIPFTAEGRKLYEQNKGLAQKDDYSFDTTIDRCASPGMPRALLSPRAFKVFDLSDKILFLFEWNRLFREIDMRDDAAIQNAQSASTAPVPILHEEQKQFGSKMGQARGHWQKDVLVADAGYFQDYRLLDGLIVTSDRLQLQERWRLRNKSTLEYQATISDPATFTKPWTVVLTFKRLPDRAFIEDVCMERQKNGEATWPKL